MRCHTHGCPTSSIREDLLEAEIVDALLGTNCAKADKNCLQKAMQAWIQKRQHSDFRDALDLQLAKLKDREDRLTDALIDRLIDKETFQQRKDKLVAERVELQALLAEKRNLEEDAALARNFLELVKSPHLTYQMAGPHQKRRLAEILFSNRTLRGKSLYLVPRKWLKDRA
ncbi:hypothetical protein GV827_21665 [Sulfitobacter sp. JBTF-M27]|uniref:Uncharacterized protein n=1 Tax=Sulfitobacter sediminilitoris TaxID=2698830 RepID=A0A6P0CHV6_9RHOB|nr:hypothetical protein [Sulfitobacter sediminilitoris]NEK24980.1 hypothetical protein [Sulfitobacter sediminilitoris]